jgi:hypothetical protein
MKEIIAPEEFSKAAECSRIVLKFTCPECGGHKLMEFVEQGEEVRTPITEVTYHPESQETELDYDYDEQWSRTKFREYQYLCADCKHHVADGTEEALAEWLMENRDQIPDSTEDADTDDEPTKDKQTVGSNTSPNEPVCSEEELLSFTCPECKGNWLLEIVTGQWSKLTIKGLRPDGEVICGDEDVDGCGERWFECGKCGYVLEDKDGCRLCDEDELLEWMKENDALRQ